MYTMTWYYGLESNTLIGPIVGYFDLFLVDAVSCLPTSSVEACVKVAIPDANNCLKKNKIKNKKN